MIITSRTVKVAVPYIQEAMTSKQEFEALAFCLFVKLNLTSSEIKKATYRRLKEVTKLGNERLKRILDYCTEHNLIVCENGTLRVLPLCKEGGYVYKFKTAYIKRNRNNQLKFNLTLAKVKDMLRRAVVANHIKRVENIREQVLLTKNPKSVQEYRKGKRFLHKLSVWGLDFFISNKRLAEVAGCSVSKTRNIKRGMIKCGEVARDYSNTYVCDIKDDFSMTKYKNFYCDQNVFLFANEGKLYKHNPNVYSYNGRNLAYVPKKNK